MDTVWRYNLRPAWLASAHSLLDVKVAAAYGWTDYTPAMSDEEVLKRLLALNQERAKGVAIVTADTETVPA